MPKNQGQQVRDRVAQIFANQKGIQERAAEAQRIARQATRSNSARAGRK